MYTTAVWNYKITRMRRNTLKKMIGGVRCKHGLCRDLCRECNAKSFCEHDKLRIRCKICSPENFCEHGSAKSSHCSKCTPCPHGRNKLSCPACNPNVFCMHGTRKSRCTQGCGGRNLCIHNKQKDQCKECFHHGVQCASICHHGKFKKQCRICKSMKYSTSSFSGAAAAAPDAAPHFARDAAAFPFTAAAADAPHDFGLFVPPRPDDFDYDALFSGDVYEPRDFMMDYDDGAGEGEEDFQGGGVKRFTKRRLKYSRNSHTKKSKKMKKRGITKRSIKNK